MTQPRLDFTRYALIIYFTTINIKYQQCDQKNESRNLNHSPVCYGVTSGVAMGNGMGGGGECVKRKFPLEKREPNLFILLFSS